MIGEVARGGDPITPENYCHLEQAIERGLNDLAMAPADHQGRAEEGFDLRPEGLPGRPLGSTPVDLESPRSQGSSSVSSVGFASLVRHSAALSFWPHSS
jgi:hypothetical protein